MACDTQKLIKQETTEFSWVKDLSRKELEKEIESFGMPRGRATLYDHQLAALLLGMNFEDFMFYLDMGLGKTIVMLYLISHLIEKGKIKKALVLVPDIGNIDNWVEETKRHTFLEPISLYGDGSKKSKFSQLEENGEIYVINYGGLQVLMSELKSTAGAKKRKREPVESLVKNLTKRFELVVFDEIQNAGNPTSLTTLLCTEIASRCCYRYGLTGTPFGRALETLWSQFFIIDGGRTFGNDFNCFRNSFFARKLNHFRNRTIVTYNFKNKLKPKFKALMNSNSITYEEGECNKLPKQIFTTIPIRLTGAARTLYANVKEEALRANKEGDEAKATYSKFRQISSGFYYEHEDDERRTVLLGDSLKLEVLENIYEDMPPKSKLVIFFSFKASGEIIKEYFEKKKIKMAHINHTVLPEQRPEEIKKLQHNDSYRVALVSMRMGSTGLNLQRANYGVYYEPHDKVIDYQQSIKRIHRTGQTKTTYYYNLIVKGSIEEKVMDFIKEGKSLRDEILKGRVKLSKLINFN